MSTIPHLAIEDLDAGVRVLETLRSMGDNPERDAAYRLVLTEIHQVTRNARDIDAS